MNPPTPCHDYDASEWVDEDGDIGPVIREHGMRAERTRWLSWVRVAVVLLGLYVVGCVAGAMGGKPWCD